MTNKTVDKDTQSQQKPSANNLFGADALANAAESWAEISRHSQERSQAFLSEIASYQAIATERAREHFAQLAKLADDSITYATKLSEEWRALAVSTARNGLDRVERKAA